LNLDMKFRKYSKFSTLKKLHYNVPFISQLIETHGLLQTLPVNALASSQFSFDPAAFCAS
jgi:hypothetical protein